jgi:hypothetical protein
VSNLEGGCNLLEYPTPPTCDAQGNCEMTPLDDLGPVDCDKAFLCDESVPRCDCYEVGCSTTLESAELSVRRVGDQLVGIVGGATFLNERHARAPLGRIVFERQL